MTPGKYDLTLYRGDTFELPFVLWEDEAKLTPVDLTDAIVKAEFRDKSGGLTVVAFTCVVTLPNTITVSMTSAMWVGAPSGGVWDLQLTFPDGEVRTVIAGKVTVTADVTDSVAGVARR